MSRTQWYVLPPFPISECFSVVGLLPNKKPFAAVYLQKLINYYNATTTRDWTGRVKSFKTLGSIGNGLKPILHPSAPEVALFSSRGPNIRDYSFQDADMLKPDILAPGCLIWSAWTPNGTDEQNYVGEGFAMMSGTSMAAPHIAGIAALVKQKHPHWSPAAIKSALMTTTSLLDRAGRPLKAQQYSKSETVALVRATPFDYGSGHVNPRAALDPGLIFDAGKHTHWSNFDMLMAALFVITHLCISFIFTVLIYARLCGNVMFHIIKKTPHIFI